MASWGKSARTHGPQATSEPSVAGSDIIAEYITRAGLSRRARAEVFERIKGMSIAHLAPHGTVAIMLTAAQCCTELSPCPLGCNSQVIELPHKRWFAAGAGGWADPLASRTAQRQPASSASSGCRHVPRPKMQTNIASVAMGPAARLSRKPHDTMIASNCYAREQYVRLRPIEDAAAKRQHDQLLFEHGNKQLNEMQQLAAQPPLRQLQVLDADIDPRQALIDQVQQAHTAHEYVCM
jgi:hypothetical protein